MTWVLVLITAWVAIAVVAALLIGRTVHTADVIEHIAGYADLPTPVSHAPVPDKAFAEH